MSYDRLAPTISSKAKKNCLVPVTWVKIIGGGAMPLSDGLDTRPCKILDRRLRLSGPVVGDANKCTAVRKVATPLRDLTCHMGSHSVTCHPAEVTFP